MCGENAAISAKTGLTRGSPPRVRGKLTFSSTRVLRKGITPACAGKTCLSRNETGDSRDHPRVCGENGHVLRAGDIGRGSPPRVRGKLALFVALVEMGGITPACAGKTQLPCTHCGVQRDHPRVCGENSCGRFIRRPDMGSPPRVRGKLIPFLLSNRDHGITPACAGKTTRRR